MNNRIFISYHWNSNSQNSNIEKLADNLKKIGYDVLFDVYALSVGESISDYRKSIVEQADIIIAILNTEYIMSEFSRLEYLHFREIYNSADDKLFVPVVISSLRNTNLIQDEIFVDGRNVLSFELLTSKINNFIGNYIKVKSSLENEFNDRFNEILDSQVGVYDLEITRLSERKIRIEKYFERFKYLYNHHIVPTIKYINMRFSMNSKDYLRLVTNVLKLENFIEFSYKKDLDLLTKGRESNNELVDFRLFVTVQYHKQNILYSNSNPPNSLVFDGRTNSNDFRIFIEGTDSTGTTLNITDIDPNVISDEILKFLEFNKL